MEANDSHIRISPTPVNCIDEMKTAFQVAEQSSPGVSELFTQLILSKLQIGNYADDRFHLSLERLTRPD